MMETPVSMRTVFRITVVGMADGMRLGDLGGVDGEPGTVIDDELLLNETVPSISGPNEGKSV